MMERRKLSRKYLSVLFKVQNKDEESFFGYISDLTAEGFNIITKRPAQPYKVYELTVLMSKQHEEENISINAICVWCKDEVPPYVYKTGFQVLNFSQNNLELLKAV